MHVCDVYSHAFVAELMPTAHLCYKFLRGNLIGAGGLSIVWVSGAGRLEVATD